MLTALALASSLWLASQDAGARLGGGVCTIQEGSLVCGVPGSPPVFLVVEGGETDRGDAILQLPDPIPVEKIADDFGRDLAWVVGSHSADLYSTAWALHRGAGVEGNPFGPTPEARIALKMAGSATTGLTLWKLRRDGHGKTATVIRWFYVAMNGLFVANNTRHAIQGR